ncbi:hypothetical protein ACWT_4108 [Actinoplanes sp. SE50]|uniref:hypothetical protein n=1 Tax=unclassified Actinoplanes TaxID=2626549 RepID=UPI00023EBF2D|nr:MULTISPECIES: hypothetical protein [unclassified Actinoplanes]AEV85132.1 hypothetical protein ACPL_4237 [Actinoplanes sp. SE50/110]ATO83523.1 hypothetical protein ACWT_4108 [Actinoplanes sp. SE50]SLM00930.1 uncharacterized protein ACSP50_4163 [Actinoplanes sp. SE50/110]
MAAKISVVGDTLHVEVLGLHKVWALRSRLEIPLANVAGATIDPGITRGWKGIRTGGTHLPGVLTAGSFHHAGERIFWDVSDPNRAVVIALRDETYARLVVEVDDPRATVDLVENAISRPAR